MTIPKISWITEPHIHDLLMNFPLPLAVLDRKGNLGLVNKHFIGSFEGSSLKSDALLQISCNASNLAQTLTLRRTNGTEAEVYARKVNVDQSVILVLEEFAETTNSKDVADLNRRIAELETLSSTDRLTGAWNRFHFDRTINVEISRCIRYRQPLVLVLLDIDHFKQINDTYGHAVGDDVLCELVQTILKNIRISDMLFRWGGEEFAILASSTSHQAAAGMTEKLRSRIENYDIPPAGKVTVSMGVAEYLEGEDERMFFKRADAALYTAKEEGRNRVVVDARGSSDGWVAGDDEAILHLQWHESYECGDVSIDRDHRKLFELSNALIDAAFDRQAHPKTYSSALDKLFAHLAQHFADEEAILELRNYAGFKEHAAEHRKLLERARKLREKSEAGGVNIGELVSFLAEDVVARHMLMIDRKFYPLFGR